MMQGVVGKSLTHRLIRRTNFGVNPIAIQLVLAVKVRSNLLQPASQLSPGHFPDGLYLKKIRHLAAELVHFDTWRRAPLGCLV